MDFKWQPMAQNSTKVKSPLANFIPERVEKPPVPISPQEMSAYKKEISNSVEGWAQASLKITGLIGLSDEFKRRLSKRPGHDELQREIAINLLQQLAQGEWVGTLGKPLYKLQLMPQYIEWANSRIVNFLTPADLKLYLCDDKNSIIRSPATCEDKLDYIMKLQQKTGEKMVEDKHSEKQKVLISIAVGQLEYMTNNEKKAGTAQYDWYLAELGKAFGIDRNTFASFVNQPESMKTYFALH